ncbi:hypothetical protein LWF15_24015 [Kineosporia rhizophila]|uniref:hypothetical protein n=1 Tax=Kineosporia rhizophila TaxID=84633 RepID=UPI001E358C3C|nr:hypothetical protein [Kineosporia rhizophila]MCE0538569.1 hypothetical protein [Kineosporia rhizophila]
MTAVALAGLLALGACAGEPTVKQVSDATAAPVDVSPSAEAPTQTEAQPKAGCKVGGVDIPADAGVGLAGDLDGDGQDDQVWLGLKGDKRLLGVRTASGASFATSFTADQVENAQASAVGNRLGDGTAIILLATAYSAALYAVIDCKIVPSINLQGNQYTFDLGMNGRGTGVACPAKGKKRYLAGFNAKQDDADSSDRVIRTRIDLSEKGARADNGKETDLGNVGYDSPVTMLAYGVTCGDAEAALEPERS